MRNTNFVKLLPCTCTTRLNKTVSVINRLHYLVERATIFFSTIPKVILMYDTIFLGLIPIIIPINVICMCHINFLEHFPRNLKMQHRVSLQQFLDNAGGLRVEV